MLGVLNSIVFCGDKQQIQTSWTVDFVAYNVLATIN